VISSAPLASTPPVSDLFGRTGRHWLSQQQLAADERATVQALLRQLDLHGSELALVDKELAVEAPRDRAVARLMTIPEVDAIAGVSIVAAIGDFTRFNDPNKLLGVPALEPIGNGAAVGCTRRWSW
jgi:transposase